MCICIWGLNQWFQHIADEGYLNAKVFPCQAAQLWVNIEGTHLNSSSDVLKVQLGRRKKLANFATRRPPYQLRPQIWCVKRDRHTTSQQFSSEGGEVHTAMVHISILLALSLFAVQILSFWCKIIHLVNKFCKKAFVFLQNSLSLQRLSFYFRL